MFQKISIVASIIPGFIDYQQVSLEIILTRNDIKTVINSGFMQMAENRSLAFKSLELGSLKRKQMLSSIWYKGKNDGEVCLFEFMDKDYRNLEMNIQITNNNITNKQQLVQPIKEGHFNKTVLEYTIKISDM